MNRQEAAARAKQVRIRTDTDLRARLEEQELQKKVELQAEINRAIITAEERVEQAVSRGESSVTVFQMADFVTRERIMFEPAGVAINWEVYRAVTDYFKNLQFVVVERSRGLYGDSSKLPIHSIHVSWEE